MTGSPLSKQIRLETKANRPRERPRTSQGAVLKEAASIKDASDSILVIPPQTLASDSYNVITSSPHDDTRHDIHVKSVSKYLYNEM